MIKIMRAKLHGIHVTGADLNYTGSITLDPEYCKLAGIYPLEFVEIWNKNNGARISTYVIFGNHGSKCCILNGAAARTCQINDQLIIVASRYCFPQELTNLNPKVLIFNEKNDLNNILEYQVSNSNDDNYFEFNIIEK